MKLSLPFAVLLLATIATVGCGSNSHSDPTTMAGSWEATLPSPSGATQYVEFNLVQSGTSVTATQVETFIVSGNETEYCLPTDNQSMSATMNSNSLSGSITTCFGTATFTGIQTNFTSMSGSYATSDGSGSFTASTVPALAGNYAGPVEFQDGTQENVSVSLAENHSVMTAKGNVTGPDAGSISLTGNVVGNVAVISGTVSGQSANLLAWSHSGGLYVVNPSDNYIFTLAHQ
jgi:hypothetical protein